MTPVLALALLLIAGSTHNEFHPGMSWPDINLPDIIAVIPQVIAYLREILEGIIPNLPGNLPDIIGNIPDLIANLPDLIANLPNVNWPEVIANLPGNLPEIVGGIIEAIKDFDIDWPAIIDLLPDINIPDINLPDIIANLPDIIANLPDLIANLPDIIDQLPDIIANLPDIDWPAIIDLLPDIARDPGVKAAIEQHPSLVQIEIGHGSIWVQGCTGSILNSVTVLTVAHAFYDRLNDLGGRRLKVGTSTRGGAGQVRGISRALVHPGFGSNGLEHDIALVRVDGYFVYTNAIRPTPIASQGTYLPTNLDVTLCGWGTTAQGRFVISRELHCIDLRVVDHARCVRQWADTVLNVRVTGNMVCAGRQHSQGRKAGLLDVGAPLYHQGVQVGLQVFGRYFGNGSMPIVGASIGPYTNWIVSNAV